MTAQRDVLAKRRPTMSASLSPHATQGRGHLRDEATAMPYVAKMKREGPFRAADRNRRHGPAHRAAAGQRFAIAGWREEAGYLLFDFPTWAKARATSTRLTAAALPAGPTPLCSLADGASVRSVWGDRDQLHLVDAP